MEAWSLVSTSRVLCTADCFLLHVELWWPYPTGHKTHTVTWHWRLCPCSACVVMCKMWTLFSCAFRTCDFPSCLSSLLIPHVKGALRGGWVTAHRPWGPCLGSVSWDSWQPLQQPRLMCWRCFCVRGPCPAAARDPPRLQILEFVKDPLGFLTHLLSQPCWPGLLGLSIPRAAGLGVTPALRTHCSIQTVLPLLPSPRPAPSFLLSLHLLRSHPSSFPSLSANLEVFMEDPCHVTLAKWNWKCLPLSSLRVWETWGVAVSIKHLPGNSGHPRQWESFCCVEFLPFPLPGFNTLSDPCQVLPGRDGLVN